MYQREIIQYINNQFPFMDELVESEDIFSCYDCENKQYIIEIKSRDKHYDPWIIEKKKFVSNYNKSKELNKEFIYLTEYRTKIITWNITNLVKVNYDFKWEHKHLPRTTEFEENKPILKEVGYLYEKYAKKY
tara:strand:- start:301 stop:696 length:396 start_codon:yes stop_codon:yes gene_type:complete